MNKITVIAAAALASFVVTTLFLRQANRSQPERVAKGATESNVAVEPSPIVPGIATHYESRQAIETRVALVDSPTEGEDNALERGHLAEYVGGIRNIAPVSVDQERAILAAKLRHKTAYETVLRDSGIRREALSTAEREYAHRLVARALNDYKENFLLEVKPVLSDEQFTMLSNYESTEYQRELARLQTEINAK